MAGIENDETNFWKNLPRLVDVYNFVGLASASSALLVAYVQRFSTLFTLIAPINLILYFATIFDKLRWIFFLELVFLLFMPSAYFTVDLSYMLLLGWILLIVGFTSLSLVGLLFLWNKQFPGTMDFSGLSAEIQLMSLEFVVVLFVNGYTMLFEWCIHQDGHVWNVTGVGLITVLVFSSVLSSILRMVYRWKKYHRAGARVSFVTSTTEAAAG